MPVARPVRRRCFALVAALALLAGCRDAPTAPQSLQLTAGGQDWVAIIAPTDLPTPDTWTPFLLRQGDDGRDLVAEVQGLERQAGRSQSQGQFARASALRRDAAQLAVRSLRAAPSADVVLESGWAVDRWLRRVESAGLADLLMATVDTVRGDRTAAAIALEAGDTIAAVGHLMAASEQIRRWSPTEIAWRALQRAERSVAAMTGSGPASVRAGHLAQSARRELRAGDPVRALERALYAIQVADGAMLLNAFADPPGECGETGC